MIHVPTLHSSVCQYSGITTGPIDVCVHVYVCTLVCIHVCVCTLMYAVCACLMFVCTRLHVHACLCAHLCVCTFVCMLVHISVSVYSSLLWSAGLRDTSDVRLSSHKVLCFLPN